jgi:hypothetical protein
LRLVRMLISKSPRALDDTRQGSPALESSLS